MEDEYLAEPCRALVSAVLLLAIRDLERGGVYQASAVQFLAGNVAADFADALDIPPARLTKLADGVIPDGTADKILALAGQGLGVDAIAAQVFGGTWPVLRDKVELVLDEEEVY